MSMNDNDVVLVVVKMLIIISIMSLSISSKTSSSSFLSQFRHSSSVCCKYILCRLNFILLLSAPCSLKRQNKLTFVFSLNLMIILIKMIIAHGQIESTERFKSFFFWLEISITPILSVFLIKQVLLLSNFMDFCRNEMTMNENLRKY